MDMEEKANDSPGIFNAKEQLIPTSEFTNNNILYGIELTVSQANAISRILPKNYSMHVDRSVKPKRNAKKTFTVDSKSNEVREVEDSNRENIAYPKE